MRHGSVKHGPESQQAIPGVDILHSLARLVGLHTEQQSRFAILFVEDRDIQVEIERLPHVFRIMAPYGEALAFRCSARHSFYCLHHLHEVKGVVEHGESLFVVFVARLAFNGDTPKLFLRYIISPNPVVTRLEQQLQLGGLPGVVASDPFFHIVVVDVVDCDEQSHDSQRIDDIPEPSLRVRQLHIRIEPFLPKVKELFA